MATSNKSLGGALLGCSYLVALPIQAAFKHSNTPLVEGIHPQALTQLQNSSEQWLNQFAQAEVKLAPGEAQLGVLLPWHQPTDQLLFTQWSIAQRHVNTTFNFGLGQRWLDADIGFWGYNLFYDHQLQGQHRRLGLGLERVHPYYAWRLNSYLPLSAWCLQRSQSEYKRPAAGLDLRLQAAVPGYPKLAVSLMGEHYWGRAATVFEQQRQQHPSALSTGLAYNPTELFGLGYTFKLGKAGQQQHQLFLALSYRFGVPLAQQIKPRHKTSLAVNHLALVQRNPCMVFDHKPNDVIQLHLPHEQRGFPGETITFPITVISPRSLAEWQIQWQGGIIPCINTVYSQATVTLPQRPGIYTLQLSARNNRGVIAQSNVMRIVVLKSAQSGSTQRAGTQGQTAGAKTQQASVQCQTDKEGIQEMTSSTTSNSPNGCASSGAIVASQNGFDKTDRVNGPVPENTTLPRKNSISSTPEEMSQNALGYQMTTEKLDKLKMQSQVQALRVKNEELKREIKELRVKNEELKKESAKEVKVRGEELKKIEELEVKNEELKREIEELRVKKEKLKKELAEGIRIEKEKLKKELAEGIRVEKEKLKKELAKELKDKDKKTEKKISDNHKELEEILLGKSKELEEFKKTLILKDGKIEELEASLEIWNNRIQIPGARGAS